MRPWLAALILLLWPVGLLAQTVTVRSGEHGAFTRLVFDVPPGADWTMTPDTASRRISLSFSAASLDFDLSQVFDRIDRTRVADIRESDRDETVEISLACDCVAETFMLRDRMLVLDIRPGSGDGDQAGQAANRESASSAPLAGDLSRVRIDSAPGIGPRREQDPLLPRVPVVQAAAGLKSDIEDEGPDSAAADPLAIGNQIAADLAAAASQGILTPSVNMPHREPAPVAQAAKDGEDTSPEPQSPQLAKQLAAGLSDVDHSSLAPGRIRIGGESCLPDSALTISAWVGPEDDINQVLSARRGAVFGEFDRIDGKALNDYAKALLYSGFGAEARAVLDLGAATVEAHLLGMSYLIDGQPDPTGLFADQMNCEGHAALWSVLALKEFNGVQRVDQAAVLRSFESLPPHLREHLGPMLSKNLSRAGYPEVARDVLRRLERMTGQETDSIALGKAQLDLKEGNLTAAETRLRDLTVEGGQETPDAVAASIELAEASDKPVPQRLVDLAESYSVEFRNSEAGSKLWRAHMRSLVLNGEFDRVFDTLDGPAPAGVAPDQIKETRALAVRRLVERADDLTFLKIATRDLNKDNPEVTTGTSLAIADRFLDLGLPEAALGQLKRLRDPEENTEARLVRAKALLALSRPEEAELVLISLRDEEAIRLRAQAREQMGDHVFAQSIYADLGQGEEARQSAWLSGDWAEVEAGQSDALSRAAALVREEQAALDPQAPTLTGAEQLSESSAAARETLRSLLDATRIAPAN